MAKVYYVKDGSYPHNLVDPLGRRIALAELERRLQGQDVRYLSTLPPEFDPEPRTPEPLQTGPRPPILWRGVKATVPGIHQYDERPFYPEEGRGLRRAVIEALIYQDLHGSDTVALTPH